MHKFLSCALATCKHHRCNVSIKPLPICWHSKLLQKLTGKKWKIKKTALEQQANCKRQLNVPWWRRTEALSVWAHSYPNSAVYLFTKVENLWPIMTKVLCGCYIKILLWWNENDFPSKSIQPPSIASGSRSFLHHVLYTVVLSALSGKN